MLGISRMKSFMSPTFSTFSSHLPKATPPALISLASKSNLCNPQAIQTINFLSQILPRKFSPKTLITSTQSRTLQMTACRPPVSGEIHVIVGPMFAGKTTTLLRRIQSESSSGRFPSFQVKPQKTFHLLDKMLKRLCFSGRLTEAVELLCCAESQVDPKTYAVLLQECIFRKEYQRGRRIHAQMVIVGYIPNEYLKTKLLILYAKSGDLKTAQILLCILRDKSTVSWNAMISGYVEKGLEEVGLNFYTQMRQNGLRPDQYTFASVFRAYSSLALLEQGKQAHGVMIKCQIAENIIVNSALVDMYFKCSSLCDGHQVFDKSLDRNVITWTSLIAGYGHHGKFVDVLEWFNRMKTEGFKPNYVTFLVVLSACSHGALVDEGCECFLSMTRDYEIQPGGQHYAAMVDLLGRAGRLEEAFELVPNSPYKEHSVIWGSLLGACRIHGNIDLMNLAAKNFFELDPENSGKYVVLSNAYSTSGLWDDAVKVRDVMKKLGMSKEPGYSRIEIQREVHFFFKGDRSHKQSCEIYDILRALNFMAKDVGYTPNLIVND